MNGRRWQMHLEMDVLPKFIIKAQMNTSFIIPLHFKKGLRTRNSGEYITWTPSVTWQIPCVLNYVSMGLQFLTTWHWIFSDCEVHLTHGVTASMPPMGLQYLCYWFGESISPNHDVTQKHIRYCHLELILFWKSFNVNFVMGPRMSA